MVAKLRSLVAMVCPGCGKPMSYNISFEHWECHDASHSMRGQSRVMGHMVDPDGVGKPVLVSCDYSVSIPVFPANYLFQPKSK